MGEAFLRASQGRVTYVENRDLDLRWSVPKMFKRLSSLGIGNVEVFPLFFFFVLFRGKFLRVICGAVYTVEFSTFPVS